MASKKNSQQAWTWRAVGFRASKQQGIVTREQLRAMGLGDRAISHALERGWLRLVFPGVFAVGHEHLTVRARMLAATMACGEGSVVSHGTAAWMLRLSSRRPEEVDVIAPVEAGRKIAGIRRRFVPPPVGGEVWRRNGVPVTSPARTIVDCAGDLDARELGGLIEQASVEGLLDVVAIDRVVDGPRRRGTKKLLRANAKLRLAGKVFEVDFLRREQKLVVETDGGHFHDNPATGVRDSERNQALAKAGYHLPRLGWEDLRDRPGPTMREIARAPGGLVRGDGLGLGDRRRSRGAAVAGGAPAAGG